MTALNDDILVKDEATASKKGVYRVTTAGAVGVQAVLTRRTDMDSGAKYSGALIPVIAGSVNAGTAWICSNVGTITPGTTAVTFEQLTIGASGGTVTGSGTSGNFALWSSSSVIAAGILDQSGDYLVELRPGTGSPSCPEVAIIRHNDGTNLTNGTAVARLSMEGCVNSVTNALLYQVQCNYTGTGTDNHAQVTFAVSGSTLLTLDDVVGVNVGKSSGKVGFLGATPVVRPATTGTSTGFTAGSGTAVKDDSTFTGGSGSTAYRLSDIVLALKQLGLLAP